MKKLFFTLCLTCFMSYSVMADTDFTSAIQSTKMPSDAEIMEIISKFNFNDEQKQIIFKDTKKKLQQMYSSKNNMSQTNADLNLYMKVMDNEAMGEYVDSSISKNLKNDVKNLPQTNETNYSSIDLSKVKYDKEADKKAQKKFRNIGK